MESLKIVLFCIVAACLYGIGHDMITAHTCVQYFTVAHPMIIPTASPVVLALLWGVIATWWVGLLLGIPLAIACRAGRKNKKTVRDLVRPVLILLAAMFVLSMLAGLLGYNASRAGVVFLIEPLASRIPADLHHRFLFDLWAHQAAYAVGIIGGFIIVTWIAVKRIKKAMRQE